MSTSNFRAVCRPVSSGLLRFRLGMVMEWFRSWDLRRAWRPAARVGPRRTPLAFESLETRLLLSADLVGDVSAFTLPEHVLPTDKLIVPVLVSNIGPDSAQLTPVVRLYASANGQVDSQSIVLGEITVKNSPIKSSQSVTVDVAMNVSQVAAPGAYSLFAVVDATNRVQESNEGNNIAAATKPLNVAWSFGTVPGHKDASSITLTDASGTRVTFALSGPGQGDIVLDGDAFDLHLIGTNSSTTLKISVSQGRGFATIDDLMVDGSLKEIQAANVDLAGRLQTGGTVRSLEFRNLADGSAISIAGTGVPVKLSASRVTGAEIVSASAFESVSIGAWVIGAGGTGGIRAPAIAKLIVAGEFAGNLDLAGVAPGLTLGSAKINGLLSGGSWKVGGSAGPILATSIDASWQGSFAGAVQKITTKGDLTGTLAAPLIGTIEVGGNMVGARLLIGANLGNNGVLNRSVMPADYFGPGQIGELRVDGTINNSTILVGVDPVDGVYGNGNDVIVGGAASRIQLIVVGGKLLGTTSFIAGAFPVNVKINGQTVKSVNVPQFHTTPPDTVAPQIAAALQHDTGASASDGVTSDPAVAGQVVEAGTIAFFSAALDSTANASFVSIKAKLQPNGSFDLDAAALAIINGGPLPDGAHTLYLRAVDGGGNASVMSSVGFVLDTSVPSLSIALDPASDSGIAGDQLTRDAMVMLTGVTDANVVIELVATERKTTSDADGNYSFSNVALVEGANEFTVRATDLAGNQTSKSAIINRDSTGPSLIAKLEHDTGRSDSDRWTNDPSLGGHLMDVSGVVSMTVAVDGGGAVEFQAVPSTDFGFLIEGGVFDGMVGGSLTDGPHVYHVRATDAAGNISVVEVDFILDRTAPTPPQFDLAPENDTDVPGDQHTTDAVVSLTGLADFEIDLALNDLPVTPVWSGNVFRIDGVSLALGENILTLRATDLAGNQSEFTRTIFRDEDPVQGGLFPDLVVRNIRTQIMGTDDLGRDVLEITWTTANQGNAIAQGRNGAWAEGVYLSNDDTPWNNDTWLTAIKITAPLAAGASQEHTVTVAIEAGTPAGYRIYVVTDSEEWIYNEDLGYFELLANEVAEKTAGEYNNLVIQDVASNSPPAPLPVSGPELNLNGTAVGGSIDFAGEADIYTFSLGAQARLYFDSLSANPGMAWTLRTQEGAPVYSRSFGASDAFGMGDANPLLNLAAGDYELVVSDTLGETGEYGFRLLNPDIAVSHALILDGGPLLRETLERGDWTDIYQFDATAGTHYVAGGPNDWAIDGALYWRMFDPAGNQIWTSTASPSDDKAFELTGTYTLMVEGRVGRTDPAQYNVYVFTPQDRNFDLTFGQSVQGFIDSPGQVNTYHFTLDQTTVAFFDGWLESNGPYFEWSLEGANGIVAGGNTRQDSIDAFGFALPMHLDAGNYALRIDGVDNAAGWYNFELFDLLHGPAQPLAYDTPATGELSRGFNSALYRFDGSAGQALTILLNPWDEGQVLFDPLQWLLVDSGGNVVAMGQDGTTVQTMLGGTGSYSLLIQGHQYNWWGGDYSVTVSPSGEQPGLSFDLAPESDNGIPGDHRTTLAFVNLVGVAPPNATLSLAFTPLTTVADAAGVFWFYDVALVLGDNTLTVRAQDAEGIVTEFTRVIYRDEASQTSELPDLAVTSIVRQILGPDEFGNNLVQVSWVTVNQGAAIAHGQGGGWYETVYLSEFDATPFSGDDYAFYPYQIFVAQDLDAGGELHNSLTLVVPDWIAPGYRFYIVVDEGNQVFEKTAGEYNNTTLEYVSSGVAPPAIAPSGPILSLSGDPTGGSIDAAGEVDIYTFDLAAPAKLLFDALSSDPGMTWELRMAGGPTLFGRNFAESDAFGMGPINALLNAGPGSYELVVSNSFAGAGQYAFRLLDAAATASHNLVLDGGALLGQTLARGDQTNVYQFDAAAGQQYVVGGPADNTIDGALYWRLFDPAGHQIWTSETEPSDLSTFAMSGTYTLVVEGRYGRTDPVNYNVYVFTPQNRTVPLTLGNPVQGFLDAPGQVNTYTFTLDEPTAVFFDGRLDSNGLWFGWTLEGPGGIQGQGSVSQDSGDPVDPLIHLGAGSYTLRISAQGDASGWYNFILMDVLDPAAPVLSQGTPVTGFLNPGFSSALYRFDGQARQAISITLNTFDPDWINYDPALWRLIDPQGNVVLSGNARTAVPADLTITGTWSLLVQGRQFNWVAVDYSLTVTSDAV